MLFSFQAKFNRLCVTYRPIHSSSIGNFKSGLNPLDLICICGFADGGMKCAFDKRFNPVSNPSADVIDAGGGNAMLF